jgi:diphthine synthase
MTPSGSLTFVGLGLGARGITLEGVSALREADVRYLEYYTTPHEATLLREVEAASQTQVVVVDRAFVEDGKKILEEALTKKVALAVPGDPMIATTHNDLRVRAVQRGIKTSVVHSSTIASAAASASGLHSYKFGRTITVTKSADKLLQQAYNAVHDNLTMGLHTLLLLEVDTEGGDQVTPDEALEGLIAAEHNFKRKVFSDDSFVIVLSRVGRPSFEGKAGRIGELANLDFGEAPHVIIVPGPLHFTESEAASALFPGLDGATQGNPGVKRTAQVLVPRYIEKTRRALATARNQVGKEYDSLFENVELYMRDAEEFLTKGEDELAMLNVGYAEGLLDSLNYAGRIKVEW